jgi:hypothetical protein
MPIYTCTTVESALTVELKVSAAHHRLGPRRAYAVEGGRVLPQPGEEAAWLAAGKH